MTKGKEKKDWLDDLETTRGKVPLIREVRMDFATNRELIEAVLPVLKRLDKEEEKKFGKAWTWGVVIRDLKERIKQ